MGEELVKLAFDVAAEEVARREFEVVVIRPGVANGLEYSPAVLQRAARLFNGVTVFCNHPDALDMSRAGGRDVLDIAGVVSAASWDAVDQCVRARLSTSGPRGQLVAELATQIVKDREAGLVVPNVGLSADMFVTRDGDDRVHEITRVLSLDVVFNPAAGGSFERVLNSVAGARGEILRFAQNDGVEKGKGVFQMGTQGNDLEKNGAGSEGVSGVTSGQSGAGILRSAQNDVRGVAQNDVLAAAQNDARAMLAEIHEATKRAQELANVQVRAACASLLEARLQASTLPAAMKEEVREGFKDRVFQAEELDAAISKKENVLAKLVEASVIKGMGYQGPVVKGMKDSMDRVQAAVDRLLGLELPDNLKDTPRLSGIRELYIMLSGDYDFYGKFFPDRVQLANATTSTMAQVVLNAMNKRMLNAFNLRPQWWSPIAHEEDFTSLNTVNWITLGGFGDLPTVAEGAAYTELTWDDYKETATFLKKGGYIGLTLEMIDKDDVGAVRAIPSKIGLAAWRTVSALVSALFTDNAGIGPTLADTGALFNATAHSSTGGHVNLLTAALSLDAWDAVVQAMYSQPELNSSKPIGVRPAYCLVPIELEKTARTIFGSPQIPGSANNDINVRMMPQDRVITVPEWTDANNWAAAADPNDLPGVCIGYRFGRTPELFVADDGLTGSMFTNDEMRIKARFFVAVGVGDWRALHKSNVS